MFYQGSQRCPHEMGKILLKYSNLLSFHRVLCEKGSMTGNKVVTFLLQKKVSLILNCGKIKYTTAKKKQVLKQYLVHPSPPIPLKTFWNFSPNLFCLGNSPFTLSLTSQCFSAFQGKRC